jgi:hypothetical protein
MANVNSPVISGRIPSQNSSLPDKSNPISGLTLRGGSNQSGVNSSVNQPCPVELRAYPTTSSGSRGGFRPSPETAEILDEFRYDTSRLSMIEWVLSPNRSGVQVLKMKVVRLARRRTS